MLKLKLFESDDNRKLTESLGTTQAYWKGEDPNDYEDGVVNNTIKRFDAAAKYLKCKASDLVNIDNQPENEEDYFMIYDLAEEGDYKDIDMPRLDDEESAGLCTLSNGCRIVLTDDWGYSEIFIKKSDLDKILRDN